jgi:septum site-determining protein MinD
MSDDVQGPDTLLALPAGSGDELQAGVAGESAQAGASARPDVVAGNGGSAMQAQTHRAPDGPAKQAPQSLGASPPPQDARGGSPPDGAVGRSGAEDVQRTSPQHVAGDARGEGAAPGSLTHGTPPASPPTQEPQGKEGKEEAPVAATAAARAHVRSAESPGRRPARTPGTAVKGRAFVVTSGKGGVGKTTVTANVGAALADAGKRVVVVDADVGLRNLDVVMGLENRVRLHSLDVLEGVCTLEEALVRDRGRKSLMLLPAAQNRDKDEIDPDDMVDLVEELREKFDLVLIDCPAGIERGFRNAVAGAQEAIIVTTPEVSAVRDADRVAGLLPSDMPARLVINRVRPHLVKKGTMMSVEDVLDILRLDLLGVVPDDRHVIVATNRGNPVIDVPGSPTGQALRDVAARLLGEDVPMRDPSKKTTWLTALKASLTFSRPSGPKG